MTQYQHPSVDTKIVDNSFVTQTADGTTTLFQAIRSELGLDNQIVEINDPSEFIFKFGSPNLGKFGQAGYNVSQWVSSGGKAFVLRVLPSTATFAIGGICLTMAKGAGTDPTDPKVEIGVVNLAASGEITSKGGMNTFLTAMRKITADAVTLPQHLVYPKGRGAGYNGIGWRLSLRSDLDATFGFRTYDFIVTAKNSLGGDEDIEGPFLVALDPEAIDKSRASLYLPKVINKYSKFLQIADIAKGFDDALDFISKHAELPVDFDPASLDILFGQPKDITDAEVYKQLKWYHEENKDEAPADLFTADQKALPANGISYILGGTEGKWENTDSEEALLVRAYSGLVDPAVLDKTFVDIDILLDANHTPAVKDSIGKLASDMRGDCLAILDLGFQANEEQTIAFRKDKVAVANRNVAIFCHDMEVFDAFNGQNVRVTSTYLLAGKIPVVDNDFGIQWTFVGPRRGIISGFENINFIPNPAWKENLYKAKINYIERDPRKINFASQLTSQAQASALSDINNVRVLLRIRKDVEALMADYRMEMNDAATYDTANYDLANYLQKWTANRACSSISGTVFASDYDRQQKLARVNIDLTFTGIMERIAINIVVNR